MTIILAAMAVSGWVESTCRHDQLMDERWVTTGGPCCNLYNIHVSDDGG